MADAGMTPERPVAEASTPSTGLIDAYLTELRHSTDHLAEVDDIVDEAADHLTLAAAALEADGRTPAEAEGLALARFGSAPLVARAHAAQAAMGNAVSTRATRWAGVAMLLTVPVVVAGVISNQYGEAHAAGWRGAVHGPGAVLEGLGLILLLVGMWGLRRRFGGLGRWGTAALILTCASPFIAAPFGWGAGAVFGIAIAVAVALLLLGAWQTPVLPRTPIALMGIGLVATAAAFLVEDGGPWPFLPGVVSFALGYLMLGWTMWHEPALDARPEAPLPASMA